MLRIDMIGHLGSDAVIHQQGIESVINFNVAHTDRYTQNGTKMEKTTWVSCSYWVEHPTIAQYLRRGTQVFISGIPEARSWKNKNGEMQTGLKIRVYKIELLGAKRDDNNQQQQPSQQAPAPAPSNEQGGYVPIDDGSDLPF